MASPLRSPRPAPPPVLSLAALAHQPANEPKPTGPFRALVDHFFIRFFAGEVASEDRDTRTRLVQVACTLAIPPLIFSLYLYPAYHLPHHLLRSWWAMAGDHYFFVLYSLVSMSMVTLFEWDLLFPDVLDVFILSPLPVRLRELLFSRVAAIFALIGAALFASNFLAPLVLPAATDPPSLFRFLAAHLIAVAAAGLFGAASLLALEGILVSILGDRLFRRISLGLQGLLVVALLTMLFLYPAFWAGLPRLLVSEIAPFLPPFWFLGLYQRILDGPAVPAIFTRLAVTACLATIIAIALAALAYPLAWWRRTRALIEGSATRRSRSVTSAPIDAALHATVVRSPAGRAIWHFIGQNLLRIPRYRMVLVMMGGLGAALVLATVLRLTILHGRLTVAFSSGGLRAIVPMVVFWTVAGLRSTFLAPADQRGRWIFRVTAGRPGFAEWRAAQRWVCFWSLTLSALAVLWAHFAEPLALRLLTYDLTQLLVAVALSLLLTDAFFLGVYTLPFTGTRPTSATNFALLLIPWLGFFPGVVFFTLAIEPWIAAAPAHLIVAALIVCAAHLAMAAVRRAKIADSLARIDPDDDEEEFPLRLGLRY